MKICSATTVLQLFVLVLPATRAQSAYSTRLVEGYDYYRCDPAQINALGNLFRSLDTDIPLAIVEVMKGFASEYGYPSFFKSQGNIVPVRSTFEKLVYHERVPLEGHKENIRIICVNYADAETEHWYASWLSHDRELHDIGSGAGPDRIGVSLTKSRELLLFPTFWELKVSADENDCPRIIKRRDRARAIPNTTQLARNQIGVLVQQLVNKYIHLQEVNLEESFVIDDCIGLASEQQPLNAMNYAMLVSGTYDIICFRTH